MKTGLASWWSENWPLVLAGGPTNRSGVGFHEAIQVGDTVFDNLRPNGIAADEFFKDLGGIDLIRQTGGTVNTTAF